MKTKLIACGLMLATAGAAPATEPLAPARDTYHGVEVVDPYRWLERGDDPAVKAWVAGQNARSRAYLDGIASHAAIAAELKRIETAFSTTDTAIVEAGGMLFAFTYRPDAQQPQVTTLALSGEPATRRVILDAAKLSSDGSIAIDWFVPSPDGRLIAASLSRNGSEDGTLHLYDVATGREIDTAIPHVQFPTGGGIAGVGG